MSWPFFPLRFFPLRFCPLASGAILLWSGSGGAGGKRLRPGGKGIWELGKGGGGSIAGSMGNEGPVGAFCGREGSILAPLRAPVRRIPGATFLDARDEDWLRRGSGSKTEIGR